MYPNVEKKSPIRCITVNKRCFLVGRKDSLFKQLVASLLVDMMDDLDLYENKAVEFDALLEEIRKDHALKDSLNREVMNTLHKGV